MFDVAVIEDPAAAEVSLDPVRARLLAELVEPSSAATLAARVGLARQKVNYHLRELERHGLVELVEERRKGNMTERVMRATAASFVISPVALAAVAPTRPVAGSPFRAVAARRWRLGSSVTSANSSPARRRLANRWPHSLLTAKYASAPPRTAPRLPRNSPVRSPRSCPSTTTRARAAAGRTGSSSPCIRASPARPTQTRCRNG